MCRMSLIWIMSPNTTSVRLSTVSAIAPWSNVCEDYVCHGDDPVLVRELDLNLDVGAHNFD